MTVGDEFDRWATAGEDRAMADRHWRTAKHALARIPVQAGDSVLDLGTGSGYAVRALIGGTDATRGYGVDASTEMLRNARRYTEDTTIEYLAGDIERLPFDSASVDHAFSMEAIYYATDVLAALREIRRVLSGGGTFYCAVDFYEENEYAHEWQETIETEMTLWSAEEYREAFQTAGFLLASQDHIPDRDREIPPAEAFPIDSFETREAMVERYRELGTLLTVGVAPE